MSEEGYKADVSINTEKASGELSSLRTSLASTNWALKVLGLPPSARASLTQIRRMISYIRVLQMLTSGSSYMGPLSMGLRAVGLGNVIGGIRIINKLKNLVPGD